MDTGEPRNHASADAQFKAEELSIRRAELELKRQEHARSGWHSPLVMTVAAGGLGILGNAAVTWHSGVLQRELEDTKFTLERALSEQQHQQNMRLARDKAEAGIILEAVKIDNPDKASENLEFLVRTGLIRDVDSKISEYVRNRKEGTGVSTGVGSANRVDVRLVDFVNLGRSPFRKETISNLLGQPRESYENRCAEVTNPTLARHIDKRTLLRTRLKGLRPAVDSLERVLSRVERDHPDLHRRLGIMGMLCVRTMLGSATSLTNHAWGVAVDISVDGMMPAVGEVSDAADPLFAALVEVALYFRDEGWYWGAGFSTARPYHFEISEERLQEWIAEGRLAPSN